MQKNIFELINNSGGWPVHSSHRGGAGEFSPENTMYSYRRSVGCKTRLIEIDLRVTKDLHLVLLHDDTVDRTTNGIGYVSDFTLEELKKFNAAHNYPNLVGEVITVPTFNEFLDEFIQYEDLMFMLDFKDELSIELTMKIVIEKHIEHRVLLGSVDQSCNQLLASIKPQEVPLITDISATLAIVGSYWAGLLKYYKIEHEIFGFILHSTTSLFWSKGLVDALHEAGCKVLVCGDELDKEEIQRQCMDYGVDFIMTDRPDILTQTMTAKLTNG